MDRKLLIVMCVAGCASPQKLVTKTAATGDDTEHWAKKQLRTERPVVAAGTAAPILAIMAEELHRSMEALKKTGEAPYFLAYQATDRENVQIGASFGGVMESGAERSRVLDVDLRVGEHALDNTHPLRGDRFGSMARFFGQQVPLTTENDPEVLRTQLWRATDKKYKRAVEQLAKVKAERAVKVEEEDRSDDFSKEKSTQHVEAAATLTIDRASWQTRLQAHSARMKRRAHHGRVGLVATATTRYLVNSEGSRVQVARTAFRINISAGATADDGMRLASFDSISTLDAKELPSDEDIGKRVTEVLAQLSALHKAPLAEPFTGPAILDGEAAGVFFHEIFGHRVEGHRQKSEDEGQTFAKKVGTQIMPAFMNVYDDPTIRRLNDVDLMGHYHVDDEAVRARRANLVARGVLREFLLSRAPTRGFTQSNGHGRRQAGRAVVARQANLVVDPDRVVTVDRLKQLLLQEIKRQKKPYGLRFVKVRGGYTTTRRAGPQAFKVLPVIVYRVYPDGREELIRGVSLEGTPLTVLSKIMAASNQFRTFNGVCGAESGWVPVSASSPSLLVRQIETARDKKEQDKPPIFPAPPPAPAGDAK